MRRIFMKNIIISLLALATLSAHAMKQEVVKELLTIKNFKKYEVNVLGVAKVAGVGIPERFMPCDNETREQRAARTNYEAKGSLALNKAIALCVDLANRNDQGWAMPVENPELIAIIKCTETYLMYCNETNQLLVRWDLGEQADGWAFDNVIEINGDPEHPRKGTCSQLFVQYHNDKKGLHGKVSQEILRDFYARAGKKTVLNTQSILNFRRLLPTSEVNRLQKNDIIAMALHFVATEVEKDLTDL